MSELSLSYIVNSTLFNTLDLNKNLYANRALVCCAKETTALQVTKIAARNHGFFCVKRLTKPCVFVRIGLQSSAARTMPGPGKAAGGNQNG